MPERHIGAEEEILVSPSRCFTSAGVDAQFVELKFGKVVSGRVDIRTNPQVNINFFNLSLNIFNLLFYLKYL